MTCTRRRVLLGTLPLWLPLLIVALLFLIPAYGIFYLVHLCIIKCSSLYDRTLSLDVDKKHYAALSGHGVPRRRAGFEDEIMSKFRDEDSKEEFDNLPALWKYAVEKFGDNKCLGHRPVLSYHPKGTPFIKPSEKKKEEEEKKEMLVKIDVKQDMLPVKGHYKWLSYKQVDKLINKFQTGLLALEEPYHLRQGEIVSIFMETRPEWQIASLSLLGLGTVFSTAYASLGIEALQYTFNETLTTHVVTSSSLVTLLLKALKGGKCPTVKVIIYAEDTPSTAEPDVWESLQSNELLIISFSQLYERNMADKKAKRCVVDGCENFGNPATSGKCNSCAQKDPSDGQEEKEKEKKEEEEKEEKKSEEPTVKEKFKPVKVTTESLALIMYTSGSTGTPKGVMLTHGNIISEVVGGVASLPEVEHGDCYLAYLPLAHIFELIMESGLLTSGVPIGYSNPRHLTSDAALDEEGRPMGDLAELRPSILTAVPLVLDKFRAGILKGVHAGPPLAQKMFHHAYAMQLDRMRVGKKSWLLDTLIFNKIKEKFGGRIRLMISGGAPLAADTQEFIATVLSPVLQGYGATETSSGGCVNELTDPTPSIVGPPMPSNEIKLVSVPDMNYLITDKDASGHPTPRGEIWIGGPIVAAGYYKNEATTKEAFIVDEHKQRWFATGDIGLWTRNGALKIIDRKKDLVKLKAGEYIALGNIETYLKTSRYVDNMCLCASGFIKRPVALVVPSDTLYKWAEENNIKGSKEEICADQRVVAEVQKSFDQIGSEKKFNKWEVPSRVHLCYEVWTPASGLLTEALKVKRKPIADRFKDVLEKIMPPEDD